MAADRGSHMDLANNLRLLPNFSESDPDTFFSLFEHVAEARDWPDSDRVMLLHCALTGKAQEAYSALSFADSEEYETLKSAVLKVYELVLEVYRQRFCTRKKLRARLYPRACSNIN